MAGAQKIFGSYLRGMYVKRGNLLLTIRSHKICHVAGEGCDVRVSEGNMKQQKSNKNVRVTIREVAAMAGVTPAVVSRLINHDPDLAILENTKARIYEAVEKTGYKPNPMARGLRRKKTGMVGLIIADFTNPFYGKLLRTIQDSVEMEGYTCLVSEAREDSGRARKLVDLYLERQVEGIILCTATENDPVIDYLEEIGEKYVLATRKATNSKACYVGFDNEKGMFTAVEYLISLGHRRIAHITGYMDSLPAKERLNGYVAALKKHGIPVEEDYIVYGKWTAEDVRSSVEKLTGLHNPPTAIVTANDVVAISVLNVIYNLGLRVPEDISLIGFNNTDETVNTVPPLTTVESPTEILGKVAASLLLEVMASSKPVSKNVIVDTKLIVRGSTGPCRKAQNARNIL